MKHLFSAFLLLLSLASIGKGQTMITLEDAGWHLINPGNWGTKALIERYPEIISIWGWDAESQNYQVIFADEEFKWWRDTQEFEFIKAGAVVPFPHLYQSMHGNGYWFHVREPVTIEQSDKSLMETCFEGHHLENAGYFPEYNELLIACYTFLLDEKLVLNAEDYPGVKDLQILNHNVQEIELIGFDQVTYLRINSFDNSQLTKVTGTESMTKLEELVINADILAEFTIPKSPVLKDVQILTSAFPIDFTGITSIEELYLYNREDIEFPIPGLNNQSNMRVLRLTNTGPSGGPINIVYSLDLSDLHKLEDLDMGGSVIECKNITLSPQVDPSVLEESRCNIRLTPP